MSTDANDVEIKMTSKHGPKTNTRWELWLGLFGCIGVVIGYIEYRNHCQADHDAKLVQQTKDEVTVDSMKTWLTTVSTRQVETSAKVAGIESTVTAIKTDVDKALAKVEDGNKKIDAAASIAANNEKKIDEVLSTVKIVMSRQGTHSPHPTVPLVDIPLDPEIPKANKP